MYAQRLSINSLFKLMSISAQGYPSSLNAIIIDVFLLSESRRFSQCSAAISCNIALNVGVRLSEKFFQP